MADEQNPSDQNPGEGNAPEGDGKGEGGGAPENANEVNVPKRRSAASHIIKRQRQKISKLKSEDDGDRGTIEPDGGGENDDGGEDGELTPQARQAINEAVEERTAPLQQKLASQEDERELQEYYDQNPDMKQHDQKIRAYMQDDAYANVPPEVIADHIAAEEARKESGREAADAEAGEQQGGGATHRPEPRTLPDGVPSNEELEDMSDEDIQKKQDEIMSGQTS